jgi:hypothetical protein
VEAADSTALDTEATTLEAEATTLEASEATDEAAEATDETAEEAGAAAMAAQAFWAAVRTSMAWLPQAASTQDVAAAVMADWLDSWHWHAVSVAPQDVDELTASEIHFVAQAGIWALARPTRATRAMAENEYCILMLGFCC